MAASNINGGNTMKDKFRRKKKEKGHIRFQHMDYKHFLEEGINQQDL